MKAARACVPCRMDVIYEQIIAREVNWEGTIIEWQLLLARGQH